MPSNFTKVRLRKIVPSVLNTSCSDTLDTLLFYFRPTFITRFYCFFCQAHKNLMYSQKKKKLKTSNNFSRVGFLVAIIRIWVGMSYFIIFKLYGRLAVFNLMFLVQFLIRGWNNTFRGLCSAWMKSGMVTISFQIPTYLRIYIMVITKFLSFANFAFNRSIYFKVPTIFNRRLIILCGQRETSPTDITIKYYLGNPVFCQVSYTCYNIC